MKQIKVTTNDGETHTYGLASGEPAPAIRSSRLEFTTPGGRRVTVPLSTLVEYTVETAPGRPNEEADWTLRLTTA